MQEKQPSLTIIIPVYNVANYLEECLDSLLSADHSLFRILLINDGSTDGSGTICQEYAKQYPKLIQCFHQKNRGLGAARNTGLSHAQTPFVTFLDGDDWYQEGTIPAVVAAITYHPDCDIFFDMPLIFDMAAKQYAPWYDNELLHQIFADPQQKQTIQSAPQLLSLQPSCCFRIFRRAFLLENSFSFQEGILWEDILPHFFLLSQAKSCRLISDVGFVYRVNRPGQITTSAHAKADSLCDIYRLLLSESVSWGWSAELRRYIHQRMIDFVFWRCRASAPKTRQSMLAAFHGFLKEQSPQMLREILSPETGLSPKHRPLIWMLSNSLYPLVIQLLEWKDRLRHQATAPRRILATCNTPMQLLVLTCLRNTFYSADHFDLLISDQLVDHTHLLENAKNSRFFDHVTEVITNQYVYETSKQPHKQGLFHQITRYLGREQLLRQFYQGPLDYDELLLFNADAFADLLFEALYRRNAGLEISLFEEGTPCYQHFSIAYSASLEKWKTRTTIRRILDKVLRHPYPFQAMVRVYAFVPALLKGVFPFETIQIPPLRPGISQLNQMLFKIFDYDDTQDDYQAKAIVFEECYLQNGQSVDYDALLKPFIEIVGKDQILIKRHPRSNVSYFEENGFRVNRSQSIPWELVALKHPEVTNSLWVSLCSGSMICPYYFSSLQYRCISLLHLLNDPFPKKTLDYFQFAQEKLMDPAPHVFLQPRSAGELRAIIQNQTQRRSVSKMHNYKLTAMIPARMGSKRIPKKNIRLMMGKPLIQYPIDLALKSDCFTGIWVNTESTALGKACEKLGAKFHQRPAELATDTATNRDFTYQFLKTHPECDYVIMINPTSPALKQETLNGFIQYIQENDFDTVFSVTDLQAESYYRGEAINFDGKDKINSQFLEPVRVIVWAITAWKRETFIRLQESGQCPVFGGKVGLYTIPKDETPDLDTEEDWNIAEATLMARNMSADRKHQYMELDAK